MKKHYFTTHDADGNLIMVPYSRFREKGTTPLAGVRAFTARHNAIQAERKDKAA